MYVCVYQCCISLIICISFVWYFLPVLNRILPLLPETFRTTELACRHSITNPCIPFKAYVAAFFYSIQLCLSRVLQLAIANLQRFHIVAYCNI